MPKYVKAARRAMSNKVLTVDLNKCGGCRTCEMICSWSHDPGEIRPSRSRIGVVRDERLCINFPVFCVQCEKPPCRDACPVNAISRDSSTGAVVINPNACIGCRACFIVCPYGAIGLDPEKKVAFKCDLCQGDPQCVKWCPREAISFEKAEVVAAERQRSIAERLLKPVTEGKKEWAKPGWQEFLTPKGEQKKR